ncbi:MAG: homogentisate 1,2-dioxygenase [Sulfitobacter sp.]|uniref:homogentisate 1,2-dioxygenase n=1 Tax=Alphaproteobacteria TaxID=28211 RepID=UPI002943237F|nr:homogentisate 1,2-dioxygenase [Sulfitobacter sp. LC.270.F.C4]WOI15277.1 homogentisate 1,2-dioxygenase [Sulfitobacter sp. LC.270.F.C4]
MNKPQSDFVVAKGRVQYNAGYVPGFGKDVITEAIGAALPSEQNRSQRCTYGSKAEQLSSSPFTAPRVSNERFWLCRMRPPAQPILDMLRLDLPHFRSAPMVDESGSMLELGWNGRDPTDVDGGSCTFSAGGDTVTSTGWCEGDCRVGFGPCDGTILPAVRFGDLK